jgi:hypothetical protein
MRLQALYLRCKELSDLHLYGSIATLSQCGDVIYEETSDEESYSKAQVRNHFTRIEANPSGHDSRMSFSSQINASGSSLDSDDTHTSTGFVQIGMNDYAGTNDPLYVAGHVMSQSKKALPELIDALLPSCPLLNRDKILFDCVHET